MKKIALAICQTFEQSTYMQDNMLLQKALRQYSYDVEFVLWQKEVDWSRYACLLPRTTWDYYQSPQHFTDWLKRVAQQTLLLNPLPVLLWNMEKHRYQQALRNANFPCIPTIILPAGTPRSELEILLQHSPWTRVVVKPSIGANSAHRQILDLSNHSTHQPTCQDLSHLLREQTMLFQPYLECLESDQERNYVFFNGAFSHVFSRLEGESRQPGNTCHQPQVDPQEAELALAQRVVQWLEQQFGELPYTRIDIAGTHIMEVELIEPYLHLEYRSISGRLASEILAEAVATRLSACVVASA